MTEKRFTTVELQKPNKWGIWYDGAYLSTYQVCTLLNEYVDVRKENEQLKKLFYEMLIQTNVEIDLKKSTRFSATLIFNAEQYLTVKEIMKDFKR